MLTFDSIVHLYRILILNRRLSAKGSGSQKILCSACRDEKGGSTDTHIVYQSTLDWYQSYISNMPLLDHVSHNANISHRILHVICKFVNLTKF